MAGGRRDRGLYEGRNVSGARMWLEVGETVSGHLANGHLANRHLANGHFANGHLANGHLAIICSGGHFANIQKIISYILDIFIVFDNVHDKQILMND